MRQGQQHRRGRGRNNNHNNNGSSSNTGGNQQRKGQNPLSRSFESNGPDVKVRGTPAHVAEKYLQLARDAQSSGDPVLAENYLQHAEHYNRIIMVYRESQGLPNPVSDTNNNGNPRSRFDGPDNDDQGDDTGQDDIGQAEQPAMPRFSQEQPPQRSHEAPRAHDGMREDRPQRSHEGSQGQNQGQNRFRDRHDRQDRPRHERPERFERPERLEPRSDQRPEARHEQRHERQDRGPERSQDRQEHRQDRGERFERNTERNFDRNNADRPLDRMPVADRMPEQRAVEPRPVEPREPRPAEAREPRFSKNRDEPVLPAEQIAVDQSPPVIPDAAPVAPTRAEAAATRRRERFGPGNEQPDFLRRPVRRPRREAEAVAPPVPQASSEEPRGE